MALLLAGIGLFLWREPVYADNCTDDEPPMTDSMSIAPLSGGSTTPATASLSLSNSNMISSATTPGNIATVNTVVTVNVSNAASYSLTLKVDNANITTNGTTLTAGNVVDNNTWGYKWDNASTYSAPSTTPQELALPALISGARSFNKNLTFAAKFDANANAGHYTNKGTLSLIATPKTATYTLADITQMQQLTLAPEACANTPYLSGQNYSAEYTLTDVRDGFTYTVRKLGDGKCWMTQNLKLSHLSSTVSYVQCTPGRKLVPDTSDVSTDWILPKSSAAGFSSNTVSNAYYDSGKDTGYYTWCATTAGTCNSVPTISTNATSSICPKGWKLPSGSPSGDFKALTDAGGITDSTAGSTKIRGVPYNFTYTGYMNGGSSPQNASIQGFWWSRTSANSNTAYHLGIGNDNVYSSTSTFNRHYGNAVRCVAE